MRFTICYIILSCIILVTSAALHAEDEIHDGFLFRFLIGPKLIASVSEISAEESVTESDGESNTSTRKDTGNYFGLQFGGSVHPDFALHGNINGISGSRITTYDNELDVKSSYGITNISIGLSYFAPNNFYIAPG